MTHEHEAAMWLEYAMQAMDGAGPAPRLPTSEAACNPALEAWLRCRAIDKQKAAA